MLFNTVDAFGAKLVDQFRHERSGIALYYPIKIRYIRPGVGASLKQKLITYDPTN